MKSFKEFCASYDNLLFRQIIEDEFNLSKNAFSEQQASLLIEKLDQNNIYSRLTQLREDYLLTGSDDDSVCKLNDINKEIYLLLIDIGVSQSDFDQKKLSVGTEGLDFSKMFSLLKSIDKKIESDKKSRFLTWRMINMKLIKVEYKIGLKMPVIHYPS